jgi:hypothetical protein
MFAINITWEANSWESLLAESSGFLRKLFNASYWECSRRMDVKTFCPNLQALQGGNRNLDMDQKAMTSTQYSTALNHFVVLCSQFGSLETVWWDPIGAAGATCPKSFGQRIIHTSKSSSSGSQNEI